MPRSILTALEACFVDRRSYAQCKDLPGAKLTLGAGAGQTEIADATDDGSTVVARSDSGTSFTLAKDASGAVVRTCDAPGKGGCPAGGSW